MYRYKIPPVIFDVLVKLRILGHPTAHQPLGVGGLLLGELWVVLQEPVQLLLVDLNLSLVDVVQDELELPRGDSVKTEERMGVFVVGEDMFEVRTGG